MTDPQPTPQQAPMDGLTPPAPVAASIPVKAPAAPPPPAAVARAKKLVVLCVAVAYGVYALWCFVLIILLPNPSGELKQFVSIGVLSAMGGAAAMVLIAGIALMRISHSTVSIALRRQSLLKIIALLIPGLILSAYVPFNITREPPLPIDIANPPPGTELVAPLLVTLSAQRATEVLQKLGYRAVKYQWDMDGDGKQDTETFVPEAKFRYQREGIYTAVVRVSLANGEMRRLTRRVFIPKSVFAIIPDEPTLEKSILFTVSNLLTDPKGLKEVTWEFGDSSPSVTTAELNVAHTYYAVGEYDVSATLLLVNNTLLTYQRTVSVQEAPPLPFPVTMVTEPQILVGSPPFGASFRIETNEPLREVHWEYGDGKDERGPGMVRVRHSFETPGIYPVITRVRNNSGVLAELTTVVKVTELLGIPDLRFEGVPTVQGNRVEGEVPLRVQLTPKTALPLIDFTWENPSQVDAVITGQTIEAVFRREGTYTLTLIGQNAEGKVLRLPVTVEVKPPSAEPVILMRPEGGVAPLRVEFDASQSFIPENEKLAGFKWSFGDEGGETREELGAARVEHIYKDPGEYTVTLRVVMTSGKEFNGQRTLVVRKPSLSACFETSRTTVSVGKGVVFDAACSTGTPNSLVWDVRYDPQPDVSLAQSTQPKYIHVFETAGDYTVTLMLKDQWGNQDKKSIAISVTP